MMSWLPDTEQLTSLVEFGARHIGWTVGTILLALVAVFLIDRWVIPLIKLWLQTRRSR